MGALLKGRSLWEHSYDMRWLSECLRPQWALMTPEASLKVSEALILQIRGLDLKTLL